LNHIHGGTIIFAVASREERQQTFAYIIIQISCWLIFLHWTVKNCVIIKFLIISPHSFARLCSILSHY